MINEPEFRGRTKPIDLPQRLRGPFDLAGDSSASATAAGFELDSVLPSWGWGNNDFYESHATFYANAKFNLGRQAFPRP